MKINELINYPQEVYAHSNIIKIFNRYINEDIITSYVKNDFGVIFLIKGKIKGFAFAVIKKKLCNYYYNSSQLTPNEYFKLREEIKDRHTIHMVDEKGEDKIKAKCMLKELTTTTGDNY